MGAWDPNSGAYEYTASTLITHGAIFVAHAAPALTLIWSHVGQAKVGLEFLSFSCLCLWNVGITVVSRLMLFETQAAWNSEVPHLAWLAFIITSAVLVSTP